MKVRALLAITALLLVVCARSAREDADPCGDLDKAVDDAAHLRLGGQHREAEAQYDRALEAARSRSCRLQEARSLSGLGALATAEGRLTEGLRHLEQAETALSAFTPSSDENRKRARKFQARLATVCGGAYFRLGWLDEARDALRRARAGYLRLDPTPEQWATVLLFTARVNRYQGETRAAADAVEEALELTDVMPATRASLYMEKARLALREGRFEEGESALDRAAEALAGQANLLVEAGPRPLVATACRDDEAAVELPRSIAGAARGAFSFHFLEALRQASPSDTWREIFERTTLALATDPLDQHPQLSGDGLDEPVFGDVRSSARGRCAGQRLRGLAGRPDRYGLRMKLYRSRGGAWRRASPPSFVVGDRLRVDLSHGHDRALFVYLLDVGLTGTVTLLFPDLDGHEALDDGGRVTVGARPGDALELFVPDDLPRDRDEGVGHLVLVASERRLSTARLLSGSVEAPADSEICAIGLTYRLRRS